MDLDLKQIKYRCISQYYCFCGNYVWNVFYFLYVIFQIFYMIILLSNYIRIKIFKELIDYRNVVDMEEIDLYSNGRGIMDYLYDKSSFR